MKLYKRIRFTKEELAHLRKECEGYVWAATESGVNRIAGNSMKEIHTSDNRQMITDILYHKPTNQMLIGSENGLFIYDCKKRKIRKIEEKTGIEVEIKKRVEDGSRLF